MIVYKIKKKDEDLYIHKPSYGKDRWHKVGDTWSRLNDVKRKLNHMQERLQKFDALAINPKDCEIVKFTLVFVEIVKD